VQHNWNDFVRESYEFIRNRGDDKRMKQLSFLHIYPLILKPGKREQLLAYEKKSLGNLYVVRVHHLKPVSWTRQRLMLTSYGVWGYSNAYTLERITFLLYYLPFIFYLD
jgi:hypothetical protein